MDDIREQLIRIEEKLDKFTDTIARHDTSINTIKGTAKVLLLAVLSIAITFITKLWKG